jgi:hypothetical protein
VEVDMIYSVQKRGGIWTVSANEVLVSFENYIDAVDTAQGAAEVFRRSKTGSSQADRFGLIPTVIKSPGTNSMDTQNTLKSVSP